MGTILPLWQQMKKEKHGHHYYEQSKLLYTFIPSVDGILGKEAKVVIAILSWLMATKTEEPISHVKGWVNGCITIMTARLYSQILHKYRVPSPFQTRDSDWESGSG